MTVTDVQFEGRTTRFHVENAGDHIQAFHARGHFYEQRQLLAHRDLIPMQCTVLDIGANVGNHTMFYAQYTWAARVYPFEPNPVARAILERNIEINDGVRTRVIDQTNAHLALGREPGRAFVGKCPENNLGGTRIVTLNTGDTECTSLDALELRGDVCFIKIDVEGMELDVLAGAARVIEQYRPAIAIEVEKSNLSTFHQWRVAHGYHLVGAFRDYVQCWNFILAPSS